MLGCMAKWRFSLVFPCPSPPLVSSISSTLPEDHPPGHQTFQPPGGGRRAHQDSRLRCEQRIQGQRRLAVEHRGHTRLHGTRVALRDPEDLLWQGRFGSAEFCLYRGPLVPSVRDTHLASPLGRVAGEQQQPDIGTHKDQYLPSSVS